MTEKSNGRRRFLAASSATAFAAVAGCMDQMNSALPNGGDGNGDNDDGTGEETSSAEPTTDDGVESPELAVETEYDSREEFRQPGEQLENFEDSDDWDVVDGTAEPDEGTYFDGSQSLRLTAEDGGNAVVETEIETTDMTDLDVSMAVRTSTPGNIAIDIQLLDLYGGYASHQLRSVTYRTSDVGWFRTCPGLFEQSSTPLERDAIDTVRITVHNTGDAEVWVDDLRTHPKPEKGYVVLCWDDGFEDFYETASPMHDEYGVNAVQAAVRQWTRGQRDGIMTIGQLKERQEAGDQIVAHGTHTEFSDLSDGDLDDALRTDKNWAVNAELEGGHYLVFPHNDFDDRVLDIVSNYYYAGGFNQAGDVNLTGVAGFDPLAMPRTIGHDLGIAKRCVDRAAAHRQCTILNFHAFDQHNTVSESEYEELLEYIDGKGDDVEVIDFDDLWAMRRSGH
ncbi:polysaccharide deacetylase family protein [Natronococcus sp. A-GB7]|uniref:polysaccharide deacetylase family protein n=1 Tax=Natronococcus sp. A-GB7 TaxID=3037649 RepID=UPI00241D5A4B|nr:polysaccharide deacetylase family protein [Natronococcus sp. A-GB7]MDG5821245.1 polysaccharide deacetylase family protein [Natronococcus sp. A-GB7]